MSLREANLEDMPFVLEMIKGLAEYEKAPEQVTLNLEQLQKDFSALPPLFESLILELENESGGLRKVGFALYYNRYSTWKGKSLYLEDLYVLPEFRGNGLGKKVMKFLAQKAIDTNCERFEWQVLDWNEPAIELYKSMGADLDGEWMNCRLEGAQIKKYLEGA